MEDDIRVLKVEYISNPLLDHTQILNLDLDLGDQSKVFKHFKWRRPPTEEDLKIYESDESDESDESEETDESESDESDESDESVWLGFVWFG